MFLDREDANRLQGDNFVSNLQSKYAVPADQQDRTASASVSPPEAGAVTPSSPPPLSFSRTPLPAPNDPVTAPLVAPTTAQPQQSNVPANDYVTYARQAAARVNIDPEQFVRQINQESHFDPNAGSPAGAVGIAQIVPKYHPNVDPTDPHASLDYAAQLMANLKKQYGRDDLALVAYNGGQGAVDAYNAGHPYDESRTYVAKILDQSNTPTGRQAAQAKDISQFGDPQLTSAEAYAACGPAAAVRFASAYGRQPTLREALDLAKTVGWTESTGMAGIDSEAELMRKAAPGVDVKVVRGGQWDAFAKEIQGGNPVTISTEGHYFFADGYDPQSGAFHVGKSGADLRGGSEWMTPAQMTQRMGAVQGALFADNPNTQAQKVQGGATFVTDAAKPAAPSPKTDSGWLDNLVKTAGNVGDAVGGAASAVGAATDTAKQSAGDFVSGLRNKYASPADMTASQQPTPSDSLTNPLGTGNAAPSAPPSATPAITPSNNPPASQTIGQAADSAKQAVLNVGQSPFLPTNIMQGAETAVGQELTTGGEGPISQARQNVGQAIAGAGDAINAQGIPLVSGAGNIAAKAIGGTLAAPSVMQNLNIIDELTKKNGSLDVRQWSPEDQTAYGNALVAVGGVTGAEGGRPFDPSEFDRLRQEADNVPPITADPIPKRPLFGRGGVPGGARDANGNFVRPEMPAPTQPQDLEKALAQTQVQVTMQKIQSMGYSPEEAANILRSNGVPEEHIQTALNPTVPESIPTSPRYSTNGTEPSPPTIAPSPPTTNGVSDIPHAVTPETPPASATPPSATVPDITKPVTAGELFNTIHSGNVISGAGTTTHVAVNTIVSPVWSATSRGAADLATMRFDRLAGRSIGQSAALFNIGNDISKAFAEHYSNPNNIANRVTNPILGNALRVQQATGAALHSTLQNVAKNAVTRMEYGALAGEQASKEGLHGGAWTKRVSELIDDPSQLSGAAKAVDLGQRASLRGEAGAIESKLVSFAKLPVVGNTLFPVVRIASQAIAQGVEKSPIGLVGTGFDVARGLAKKGPYAKGFNEIGGAVTPLGDRLTNNIAGTALTAFAAQKAMDGTITGNGPDDPNKLALLTSQGWQPHSVYVPGRGYVDYHILGSLAVPLALAGAYADAQLYGKHDSATTAAIDMSQSMVAYLENATGLRTIGDLSQLLRGGQGADALIASFAGNIAGGFVPESGLVRSIAQATDPLARKPNTKAEPGEPEANQIARATGEVIKQNIPGLRQTVAPSQDVLGRTQQNPAAGIGALLPNTAKGKPSPTLKAFSDVGVTIAPPPSSLTRNGMDIPMSNADRQVYGQVRGQLLDTLTQGLTSMPAYQNLSTTQKQLALLKLKAKTDDIASKATLMQMITNNQIVNRLAIGVDNKQSGRAPLPAVPGQQP